MRALLWVVGVVAGVLILLGLVLEAVRWLIIIGVIALVIVIVWGVVKGRQADGPPVPPTVTGGPVGQNQSGRMSSVVRSRLSSRSNCGPVRGNSTAKK